MKPLMIFLLSLLMIPFLPHAAQAQDVSGSPGTIEKFDVILDVQNDGTLDVTETITVNFPYERHGIFRYVPYRYTGDWGLRYVTPLELQSILQDGAPAQVEKSTESVNVVWKIGDADVTITGDHVYTLRYSVRGVIQFGDNADTLYWNVTGNDWGMPIDNVSVQIYTQDDSVLANAHCFTGVRGSTSSNCTTTIIDSVIHVTANDELTVIGELPKGVVQPPSWFAIAARAIVANLLVVLALLALPIPFLLWYAKGRDPFVAASSAEYDSPQGKSAAYLAAFFPGLFRQSKYLIAAMMVTLAQKGHLRIHIKPGSKMLLWKFSDHVSIEKLSGGSEIDAVHKKLYAALFKKANDAGMVSLSNSSGLLTKSLISEIRRDMHTQLVSDGMFAPHSFRWRAVMTGLGTVMLITGFYGAMMAENVGLFLLSMNGLLWLLFAAIIPRLTPQGAEFFRKVRGFKMFMHTAERYRSAWHERENMFTEYLPYAIAFADVDRWAKTFAGTQQSAPSWYRGYAPLFVLSDFSSHMGNVISTVSAAMPSSRGGSGSSSGGGFGGGGGGSW